MYGGKSCTSGSTKKQVLCPIPVALLNARRGNCNSVSTRKQILRRYRFYQKARSTENVTKVYSSTYHGLLPLYVTGREHTCMLHITVMSSLDRLLEFPPTSLPSSHQEHLEIYHLVPPSCLFHPAALKALPFRILRYLSSQGCGGRLVPVLISSHHCEPNNARRF